MNEKFSHTILANLIKQAVESEGCKLAEIDFENLLIKVDGPEEVVGDCARALEEII